MQFLTDMAWSAPQEVKTRNGNRLLRTAEPNTAFWDAWKANKDALRQSGISCGKDERTNKFLVKAWNIPGQPWVWEAPGFTAPSSGQAGYQQAQAPAGYPPQQNQAASPQSAVMQDPAVQAVMETFPGAQLVNGTNGNHAPSSAVIPLSPIVPEMPACGFNGMTSAQRLHWDLQTAVVRALETQQVTREQAAALLSSIAGQLR